MSRAGRKPDTNKDRLVIMYHDEKGLSFSEIGKIPIFGCSKVAIFKRYWRVKKIKAIKKKFSTGYR